MILGEYYSRRKIDVLDALSNSGRHLDTFYGFLNRVDELRHSYEKFRFAGGVNKPSFEEVYHAVHSYIQEMLPKEKSRDSERSI